MDKWIWLSDANWIWKAHLVCEDLANELELDLNDRVPPLLTDNDPDVRAQAAKGSIWSREPRDVGFFDFPGMCLQHRSIRGVQIGAGFKIEIPSQDWYGTLAEVKMLRERRFKSGATYYKMHARFYCIVLTPEQRQIFIKGLEDQLQEAEVEAEADNKRFAEGIRAINEHAGRQVVVSQRAQAIEQGEDKKNSN